MSSNIWDDEEEFRDNPVEYKGDKQWEMSSITSSDIPRSSNSDVHVAVKGEKRITPDFSHLDEFVEEIQEESDESEDYSEVLNDARLRLEQGRLYEMVMNHSIFDGLNADPAAVKHVEKEIRKFAKERMEIMLGMRTERPQTSTQIVSQFNELEVDLLKQLAAKMSQGRTQEYTSEESTSTEDTKPAQRQTGLNTIKAKTKLPPPVKQLKKTAPPLERKKSTKIDHILAEEGVTRKELEEDYQPLRKPIHELSPQEQAERIRQTQQRLAKHKPADNPNKAPMPSYEQQEMMAASFASSAMKSPIGAILQNLNNRTPKQ